MMQYRTGIWLRRARIILSVLCAVAAVAAVLLPYAPWAAWERTVQLWPAVAAFAFTVFVPWIALTLLLGRVYCSTVCPLGTAMDCASRLRVAKPLLGRRRDYRYSPPVPALRYGVLAGTVALMALGLYLIPSLLDPWTLWERFATRLLALCGLDVPEPPAAALNVALGVTTGLLVTAVTMGACLLLAWAGGRTVCNTVCPVGTTLGIVSRYAVYQPDIDTDKCIGCGRCADVCKAHCIDLHDHTVDGSRCVVCFDCITVCPNDAIHYTATRKQLAWPLAQRTVATALNTPDQHTRQPR